MRWPPPEMVTKSAWHKAHIGRIAGSSRDGALG
jgi:hypothetical protein